MHTPKGGYGGLCPALLNLNKMENDDSLLSRELLTKPAFNSKNHKVIHKQGL